MSLKYIVTFEVCAVFLLVHTPRRLPAAVCYPNLQQPLCIPFVPDLSPHVLARTHYGQPFPPCTNVHARVQL